MACMWVGQGVCVCGGGVGGGLPLSSDLGSFLGLASQPGRGQQIGSRPQGEFCRLFLTSGLGSTHLNDSREERPVLNEVVPHKKRRYPIAYLLILCSQDLETGPRMRLHWCGKGELRCPACCLICSLPGSPGLSPGPLQGGALVLYAEHCVLLRMKIFLVRGPFTGSKDL